MTLRALGLGCFLGILYVIGKGLLLLAQDVAIP